MYVLCILFHCVVLCIVCVQMCTVLLPLGVNLIIVNKIYIISYVYTLLKPVSSMYHVTSNRVFLNIYRL